MKAWQLNDFGLENLVLSNVNLPEPKPNEIVVKVSAVSLNYRDKAIVDGIYEPEKMPKGLIPVADAAGVVVQTGSAVTRFTEGDRVASISTPAGSTALPQRMNRTSASAVRSTAVSPSTCCSKRPQPSPLPTFSPTKRSRHSRSLL